MSDPVKLLIVDDSRFMRDAIAAAFDEDDSVIVVGQAANGVEALESVKQLDPDVLTLDVEMPVMDGLTTLKHLMINHPKPVIMFSSLTHEGARVTFDALRYGAVDFITKPSHYDAQNPEERTENIRKKVLVASDMEVEAVKYIRAVDTGDFAGLSNQRCEKIVAIGASEGGYGPLLKIVPRLKHDVPVAYIATIYAEPEYIDAFAQYLNQYSRVTVKRAEHGEVLHAGVCYLGSGMDYMTVHTQDKDLVFHVDPAPFGFRKGSVDMLLFSVADLMTRDCIGVVLSGKGIDGAEGLEEVVRMGGTAIVQAPKSSLYREMPHAAMDRSDVDFVVPDGEIATTINSVL